MKDTITNQMHDRFQLETSLLRLKQQLSRSEDTLRQAKFNLREAKVTQAEYSGSFRSFRDKLTGKREESETALRHAVQQAEAALASAQRQKDSLVARLTERKEQLAVLPAWESLRDGSRELLAERRSQFTGSYAGEGKSRQDLAEISSAPEAAGEACRPWLLRLKEALDALEIPLELHRYFLEPTAFLSSATQYTRMDRINEAIAQAEKLQRLIPKLRKQLVENV